MNYKRMLLMAALGLTASALSSYATQVQVIDALNLTNQGPLLISNSGGGNQHGQAQDPLFVLAGDLPRLIFQRSQFSTQASDYSYLAIYQGTVQQNKPPPAGSTMLNGSNTLGSANPANPPDFVIDFGAPSPPNAPQPNAASQIQALLLAAPNAVYTIAVVEVNVVGNSNQKLNTRGSIQFQFNNLNVINGQLVPSFNITTQLGNG
jgi:hypothetical protein